MTVDVDVFATGFDAMTGAILAVHPITGRGGKSIDAVWAHGPHTYLGLTVTGFPNMFLVTGPGNRSALSNMTVSIEQHADWVVDRLIAVRGAGMTTIEATETAQAGVVAAGFRGRWGAGDLQGVWRRHSR